jgi:hypothetical protein
MGDPGFVPPPIDRSSQSSRNLLLVLGVLLIAALLAGVAVNRSRQRHEVMAAASDTTTASVSTSTPAVSAPDQRQSVAPPQTPPPQPEEVKPSAPQQPAVMARKAKTPDANSDAAPGPSAAEIQAQQQAALEQKRLLDAMETQSDQLDGRAATVESSLDTLEQQMHSNGLGLRGDMVAARSNMRTDITKAKQAMDSGDTDRARHYLDMALHEVEKLEAFLGHR